MKMAWKPRSYGLQAAGHAPHSIYYLRRHPNGVSVDNVLQHNGADKLRRVYPA